MLKTLKVLIAGRGGDSGGGLGQRARANRSALQSIFDLQRISDTIKTYIREKYRVEIYNQGTRMLRVIQLPGPQKSDLVI